MSQLAIYVLIFVLLAIYVPLAQLNNMQQKSMQIRRRKRDERSAFAQKAALFAEMSIWQKCLIFMAICSAVIAIFVLIFWEKIAKLVTG